MIDGNKNPWITLETNRIYANPSIKVSENQVLNPRGGQRMYRAVSCKNKAIAIAPINHAGNTGLIQVTNKLKKLGITLKNVSIYLI